MQDVIVEFDIASARKYIRAISHSIAAVFVVAIAIAIASRQWIEDVVRIKLSAQSNDTFGAASTTHMHSRPLGLIALGGIVLALVLLGIPRLLCKTLEAQRCWITATQIVCESGWLNRSVQTIPLDRIQDLSVKQGFLQRRFGLFSIEVQTAGSPSPFPELVLYAPRDASSVRDAIMARRDALQSTSGSRSDAASPGTTMPSASDVHATLQTNAAALAELNRTMQRIEALLVKALGAASNS